MSSVLGSVFGSGLTNQYHATAPVSNFQANPNQYNPAVAGAQTAATAGTNANAGIQTQQNALAAQLGAQAAGAGPNPALAQLRQTTGQNINNAAGQVASTRGINPALAARLAADQGAGLNQQAAGQAATQTAQQTLAAQQQLAGVLGQQAGQNIAQQQANTSLLGTAGGLQTQNEQLNQLTAAQNQQANLAAQQIQAGVQGQNAQTNAGLIGGLLNGAGAAATLIAGGGMVPSAAEVAKATAQKVVGKKAKKMDSGGDPGDGAQSTDVISPMHLYLDNLGAAAKPAAPSLSPGQLQNPNPTGLPDTSAMNLSTPLFGLTPQNAGTDDAQKGKAGKAVGAGLSGLGQGIAQAGGANILNQFMGRHLYGQTMAEGGPSGNVHGPEVVQGDSEKNDVVPALLSGGEHVTRKEVAEAPGVRQVLEHLNNSSPAEASSFAQHLMRRRGAGYDKVLKARRMADGGDADGGTPPPPPPTEAKTQSLTEKLSSMLPDWMAKHGTAPMNMNERKMMSQVKGD
jgi:hypothetical protein